MFTLVTLVTIVPTPRWVSSPAPLILYPMDIIPRVFQSRWSHWGQRFFSSLFPCISKGFVRYCFPHSFYHLKVVASTSILLNIGDFKLLTSNSPLVAHTLLQLSDTLLWSQGDHKHYHNEDDIYFLSNFQGRISSLPPLLVGYETCN